MTTRRPCWTWYAPMRILRTLRGRHLAERVSAWFVQRQAERPLSLLTHTARVRDLEWAVHDRSWLCTCGEDGNAYMWTTDALATQQQPVEGGETPVRPHTADDFAAVADGVVVAGLRV